MCDSARCSSEKVLRVRVCALSSRISMNLSVGWKTSMTLSIHPPLFFLLLTVGTSEYPFSSMPMRKSEEHAPYRQAMQHPMVYLSTIAHKYRSMHRSISLASNVIADISCISPLNFSRSLARACSKEKILHLTTSRKSSSS